MEVVNFASTQSLKGLGSFIYLFILGINISSTSDAIRLILAKIFSNTVHKTSKGVPAQGCSSPQRVLQQQAGFGSLQCTAKQSQ